MTGSMRLTAVDLDCAGPPALAAFCGAATGPDLDERPPATSRR
ncbi:MULTISPECIES: hypothetical protein [Streptomyces]|nr:MULTISPECIES: hypothetical protein [Streptomyces]WQG69838.1 hypothetical protein SR864_01115 [Streptomyces albidoflavus]